MRYRQLGKTNLSVSVLAMGGVELGLDYGIRAPAQFGRPPDVDGVRLVHAALDEGINLFDTARGYGESERVLGKALRGRRDRAVLATKASAHDDNGQVVSGRRLVDHLRSQLDESLRALQMDYVDIWQIHRVDADLLAAGELVAQAFAEAKQSGKVRWAGGSFYGDALPLQTLDADWFDTMQVTYSVLDQRISDQFLPRAAEREIGILARSVLLKGALTERAEYLPEHLQTLRARSRRFRRAVAEMAAGVGPSQAAIAFALANPHLGSVLVGVRSEAELLENVQAVTTTVPEPLMAQLREMRLDDPSLLNPGTWNLD